MDGPTDGPTEGRTTRLLELLRAAKNIARSRKAALRNLIGFGGVKLFLLKNVANTTVTTAIVTNVTYTTVTITTVTFSTNTTEHITLMLRCEVGCFY